MLFQGEAVARLETHAVTRALAQAWGVVAAWVVVDLQVGIELAA